MFARVVKFALLVPLSVAILAASTPVDARGGGGRGGGGFGRGGGGFSHAGGGGFNRGGGYGGYGGGRSAPTNVNRGYGGNRINTGDVNRGYGGGNRINTGDVNRGGYRANYGNVGNNVNIGVDPGWGVGAVHHPVAAGIAVGAIAGATAAAIGSTYYALPAGCSPYYTSYYYCDGNYYQPRYQGTTVEYVVVDKPSGSPPPPQ